MLVSFPRDMIVRHSRARTNLLNAAYSLGGPPLVIETLEAELPAAADQPLPRGRLPRLQGDRERDRARQALVPDPRARSVHRAQRRHGGLREPRRRPGARLRAVTRVLHPRRPAEPGAVAVELRPEAPANADRGGHGWINDPLQDLDRIPRQQYFLRTLSQAAIAQDREQPAEISGLLDKAFKNLVHDQNLKYNELTSLAYTFRDLDPRRSTCRRSRGRRSGRRQPRDRRSSPTRSPSPTACRTSRRRRSRSCKPLVADKVKVRVVNGSGVKGAGADVLDTFTAAGFESAGPAADADRSDYKTPGALRAREVQRGIHGGDRRRDAEPRAGGVGEEHARRRRAR